MIERLVQCKASAKDVVEFNATLNNSKTTLINADKFSPWGGTAWEIELPIFIEDISSKIVIMNGRRSFYLRVPASHPEKIIPILANQFQLTSISTDMTHLDFRRSLETGTVHLLLGEDTSSYWLGCFYDQNAVSQAQETLKSVTPSHLQRKQRLLRELNMQ